MKEKIRDKLRQVKYCNDAECDTCKEIIDEIVRDWHKEPTSQNTKKTIRKAEATVEVELNNGEQITHTWYLDELVGMRVESNDEVQVKLDLIL